MISILNLKLELVEKQLNSYFSQYFNLTNEILELATEDHISNKSDISFLSARKDVIKTRINKLCIKHGV